MGHIHSFMSMSNVISVTCFSVISLFGPNFLASHILLAFINLQ